MFKVELFDSSFLMSTYFAKAVDVSGWEMLVKSDGMTKYQTGNGTTAVITQNQQLEPRGIEMDRNYKALNQLDIGREALIRWANARDTDFIVAVAIHAIADCNRPAADIWADPTPAEVEHVRMAIVEYHEHRDFNRVYMAYFWGESAIILEEVE